MNSKLQAEAEVMDVALGQGDKAPDQAETERLAKLDALGASLAKGRSDAISARQASGIEQQWLEDEEFYSGIDDANRDEYSSNWRTKPPGAYRAEPKASTRSTVFVNITRPYCDAGAARFADMILPSDDRNFEIRPTPIPDLEGLAEGKLPANIEAAAKKSPDQAGVAQMIQQATSQAADMMAEAKRRAKKAQIRIDDWHVEGQFHAEVRKCIENSGRIGSGVLKGPFPQRNRVVAFENGKLIIKSDLIPVSKSIDPWNFYPDGACGTSIHNGAFTWERDYLTEKRLQKLKGQEGYIDAQINACLEEGPMRAIANKKETPNQTSEEAKGKRFEVWYFYGTVKREDLEAADCDCSDQEGGDNQIHIPATLEMVNDRVIKASLNPLDSGEFPYDVFPWQSRDDVPWGNGIARHGRTPQRMVNASTRNMMDNAGLCGGPQIVVSQGMITPANGDWTITPRKVWYWSEDSDVDDVRKAMAFFEIPSSQEELMAIVQFGLKSMEDSTGLPMLLQGQVGEIKNQPLGTVTLANNNASTVLRRLARTFDDRLTEPHVRRYYNYLLQYGPADDEKGDFHIDARGSSALVERDLQAQEITQMANIVLDPRFGLDPKKWAIEMLKSKKFNPLNYTFDDEQWKKIIEGMAKQGGDPRMAVAQLNAETQQKLLQIENQFKASEGDKDRNVELVLKQVDERIAEMKQQGATEISFADMKAMLASVAMKLSAQRELSAADLAVDVGKHKSTLALAPPVEPVGKAPSGQAFAG